jgi:predicted RNA binding protein YcfA (HicA-like mRNA interferase family)
MVILSKDKNIGREMKVKNDGWTLIRTKGSHRQYKHNLKKGWVAISGHPGDDIASGTLNSALKQAGLK